MTKSCKECNQELPIEVFPSAGKVKGVQYYKSYCKICDHIKAKQYKLDNIERWKAYMKKYSLQWYAENKEKNLEYCKKYNLQYYAENREKYLEYYKEYYPQYYAKNSEKIKEYLKEYSKKKRKHLATTA